MTQLDRRILLLFLIGSGIYALTLTASIRWGSSLNPEAWMVLGIMGAGPAGLAIAVYIVTRQP